MIVWCPDCETETVELIPLVTEGFTHTMKPPICINCCKRRMLTPAPTLLPAPSLLEWADQLTRAAERTQRRFEGAFDINHAINRGG